MCLDFVRRPARREGLGYKNVRITPELEVFVPEYPFFYKNGRGGLHPSTIGVVVIEEKIIRCARTIYTVGKVTRSLAGHLARVGGLDEEQQYRAGIHLYKCPNYLAENSSLVCIECEYWRAIAEDDETVVALEVRPTRVLSQWYYNLHARRYRGARCV